ncbi:MAG: DNA replication/repair protein RecF [Treponema sp.]|nr:DNA replication/repair protein RecF [Treponema sp.]
MFETITTRRFRNLEDASTDVGARRVFLVGENGQGKTNFLDAVYSLCYGASFRGASDAEAARHGEEEWSLSADTRLGPEDPRSRVSVSYRSGRKGALLDGKSVPDRKAMIERNPAVVFCPSDMDFAQGEPERRRFFLDQTASLVSPAYLDSLRSYRKVLRMRNLSLKERRLDVLEVLDEQLSEHGAVLRDRRAEILGLFDPVFAERYESVSRLGVRVGLEYRPSWKPGAGPEEIAAALRARRQEELALGMTLSGPHRDRFRFTVEGGDFSAFASTGQLRLLALTLRSAQAGFCAERTGREPLLLLDDVLLELDPEKRRRFMENLPPHGQAFFTFLPGEPYGDYAADSTMVYWVSDGRLSDTDRR